MLELKMYFSISLFLGTSYHLLFTETVRLLSQTKDSRFVYTTTKTRRFRVSIGHFISNKKNLVHKTVNLTRKRSVNESLVLAV